MKQSFFVAGMILLAASCSNERVELAENALVERAVAPVTVSVSGFSITQEGFAGTRGTAVSTYEGVNVLTLAFYDASDGSQVFKQTQVKDNPAAGETFGQFSTTLAIGNYTMVVIANGGHNAVALTSPTEATYGENRVLDTFVNTQTVTVSSTAAVSVSATLDRVVTALAVLSTDNRPEGVTHMRLTYSGGGKGFNPTTGLATSNDGFVNLMDYPTSNVNTTTAMGGFLFLATDEQTMDVTIETLDAADGNVLFSKTVTGVPLKRNRQTTLTGAIYSNARVEANSFEISGDWISSHSINF
jgi:hypothetical protein